MAAFLVIVAGLAVLFPMIPTSFLPDEDQGNLMAQVQMPPNSSAERTQSVLLQMADTLLKDEAETVDSVMTIAEIQFRRPGSGIRHGLCPAQAMGERTSSVFDLAKRAMAKFNRIKEGTVIAFAPPAVMELGNATGFNLFLEDRSGGGHERLIQARNQFLGMAAQNPALVMVRPNGMNDEPQFQVLIDDEGPRPGIDLSDVNSTMSAAWGSDPGIVFPY